MESISQKVAAYGQFVLVFVKNHYNYKSVRLETYYLMTV